MVKGLVIRLIVRVRLVPALTTELNVTFIEVKVSGTQLETTPLVVNVHTEVV